MSEPIILVANQPKLLADGETRFLIDVEEQPERGANFLLNHRHDPDGWTWRTRGPSDEPLALAYVTADDLYTAIRSAFLSRHGQIGETVRLVSQESEPGAVINCKARLGRHSLVSVRVGTLHHRFVQDHGNYDKDDHTDIEWKIINDQARYAWEDQHGHAPDPDRVVTLIEIEKEPRP